MSRPYRPSLKYRIDGQFNVNANVLTDEFNLYDHTSTIDTSDLDLSFLASAACEMSGEIPLRAVVAGETAAAEDEVPVQVQVAADDETATEEGEDEQPALISQPTVTDVILESVKTPLKAKRGIPSFYSGKVSPSCICQPHILAESTHEK